MAELTHLFMDMENAVFDIASTMIMGELSNGNKNCIFGFLELVVRSCFEGCFYNNILKGRCQIGKHIMMINMASQLTINEFSLPSSRQCAAIQLPYLVCIFSDSPACCIMYFVCIGLMHHSIPFNPLLLKKKPCSCSNVL